VSLEKGTPHIIDKDAAGRKGIPLRMVILSFFLNITRLLFTRSSHLALKRPVAQQNSEKCGESNQNDNNRYHQGDGPRMPHLGRPNLAQKM
jgi:hypothetical protein